MAFELGKIAMHTRIFVRLTDRTHVVPDDKSGRVPIGDVAWKHARRAAQAPQPDYAGKPQARRSSTASVDPDDRRPLHLQRHPAQGDAVLQLRPDQQAARAA